MTEEDFLKRWSRRKREADVAKPVPPEKETGETGAIAPETAAAGKGTDAPDAEFDITTLPPIESINAVSDITAFLRAGVPVELTRAALRRVWTADPAIRNFVGLAENAWDFTDPDAMPGFGPLESSDEVRRMIADLVDRIGEAAKPGVLEGETERAQIPENSSDSNLLGAPAAAGEPRSVDNCASNTASVQSSDDQVLVHSNQEDTATQHNVAERNADVIQLSRRPHGGALPR